MYALNQTPCWVLKHLTVVHSLKTALAIILSYILVNLLHLPSAQWVLITVIVVMSAQSNIGSYVKKSYARCIGTLLGAVYGILTLVIWRQNIYLMAIMLAIGTFIFTQLAGRKDDLSYAGVLGIITVIMIVMAEPPTIINGLMRVLDVFIGIFISAVVIFLVLPTYAQALYVRNLKPLLIDYADLFHQSIVQEKRRQTHASTQKLDSRILSRLIEQKKLITDSKAEWPQTDEMLKTDEEILRLISIIHRHLNFMEYYFHADPAIQNYFKNQPSFSQYCLTLQKTLYLLAENAGSKPTEDNTKHTIEALANELNQAVNMEQTESTSFIHAFLLSARRIDVHINELKRLFSLL